MTTDDRGGCDAFSLLELDRESADEAAVQSAFRRLALSAHPDKAGGDVGFFAALSDARARALAAIRLRPTTQDVLVWSASDWAVYIAYEALRATAAPDLEVDLKVTLDDLYHGRTKRVVFSVMRADRASKGSERPYKKKTLLVRLVSPSRDRAVADGDAIRFEGAGNDPPSALLGAPGRRGDVVVRVRLHTGITGVTGIPASSSSCAMRPDTVLWPCDLHASVELPFSARYRGAEVRLPHPGGRDAVVRYVGQWSSPDDGDGCETRQVRVLEGWGLPYRPEGRATALRGDLYVFMDVRLPSIAARSEEAERALDVLDGYDVKESALAS